MGSLKDGIWSSEEDLKFEHGRFRRETSSIRHQLGCERHPAESGRYRLYAHLGCPWAHRTRIALRLLGLESHIEECLVAMMPSGNDGWVFEGMDPEGRRALHEVYRDGADSYTGRATVPVLFDTRTGTIVNNESTDIIRMLDTAFGDIADCDVRLFPVGLSEEIEATTEIIHEGLNDAVYRAGFARTQEAHDEAVDLVFETLDWLEGLLADGRPYLLGRELTGADVQLCTTLFRFEAYREVFYCDLLEPDAHPHVWAYRGRLLQIEAVASTALPAEAYIRGYGSIPFSVMHNPEITRRRISDSEAA